MSKEGYKPTSGMQSAARRAIKLKEQGKAKGAGTAVGWTRAGQLARGETLSLSTVKRMYSYFSRHEVDKKGKDWDNAENPSNGKIMWLAWGGDAGFSWSRKIVNREKNMKKSVELNEIVEEIKSILDDVVNPITKVIEIEDDLANKYDNCGCETCKKMDVSCEDCPVCSKGEMDKADMTDTKDCKCEGCMECKANGGCTEKMCSGHKGMKKSEDLSDEEISKSYESDNEEEDKWDNMEKACWSGYKQEGMKDKGGRMVPNCVPVEKSMDNDEDDKDMDKAKDKENYKEVIGNRKGEPSDKELYSRIISEAKRKFDVYPSAYANGWVVQEYKRRGGTYNVKKSIWDGTFIK